MVSGCGYVGVGAVRVCAGGVCRWLTSLCGGSTCPLCPPLAASGDRLWAAVGEAPHVFERGRMGRMMVCGEPEVEEPDPEEEREPKGDLKGGATTAAGGGRGCGEIAGEIVAEILGMVVGEMVGLDDVLFSHWEGGAVGPGEY